MGEAGTFVVVDDVDVVDSDVFCFSFASLVSAAAADFWRCGERRGEEPEAEADEDVDVRDLGDAPTAK